MPRRRLPTKKLLVAAVGVGAVSYIFACSDGTTSGNLMAPKDSGAVDAPSDAPDDVIVSSGNLMAPLDSGAPDADADTDAGDAGDDQ